MKPALRRVFVLILTLVMVLSLAACGDTVTDATETDDDTDATTTEGQETTTEGEATTPEPDEDRFAETITISQTVLDAEKTGNTARDQWFNEKFNVEWDFVPVTWGDWTEKVRAMIAGDDLPDLLWWDMKLNHTSEFRGWAEAGAFREIPANLSEWPNLAAKRDVLVSDEQMLTVDGKLFGWPAHRNNPEWVQNVYYPLFAYRRDWAQAVDLYNENDQYTWDEVKTLIDTIKAEDPGDNGAGNTFGITSEAWAFPGVFLQILDYSDHRQGGYVRTNDGWVPRWTLPEYRDELKHVVELYRGGYIWRDQMVVGGGEGAENFFAGRSFMFLGNNSPNWLGSSAFPNMVDSGVVDSTDDVAPMMVFGPKEGKRFTLVQTEDYWTVTHHAYHMSDEKQQRVLDMWDWLASEEGRAFLVAGIPEVDYRPGNGSIEILWDRNEAGELINPYHDTGGNMYTPATLVASPNETTRMSGFDAFEHIHEFMQNSPDYHVQGVNWDVATFGGDQYSTYGDFGSDVTNKVKEIMAATDDVDAMWDDFLAEMEPKWRPVADELDAELG